MREQKKPKTEYYKDQPVNQPIEIAKAIGQLAADPNANGKHWQLKNSLYRQSYRLCRTTLL
jgi:hypothetical protein